MENRIYEFVNIGILIRCVRTKEGKLFRYIGSGSAFLQGKRSITVCTGWSRMEN